MSCRNLFLKKSSFHSIKNVILTQKTRNLTQNLKLNIYLLCLMFLCLKSAWNESCDSDISPIVTYIQVKQLLKQEEMYTPEQRNGPSQKWHNI